MGHIIESVGWSPKDGEHHTRGLLRLLVLSRMGRLGHEATVAEARKRFAQHADGSNRIPADLRSAVYNTVMANGDKDAFDKVGGELVGIIMNVCFSDGSNVPL